MLTPYPCQVDTSSLKCLATKDDVDYNPKGKKVKIKNFFLFPITQESPQKI